MLGRVIELRSRGSIVHVTLAVALSTPLRPLYCVWRCPPALRRRLLIAAIKEPIIWTMRSAEFQLGFTAARNLCS